MTPQEVAHKKNLQAYYNQKNPKNVRAACAERLGFYTHAKVLWQEVADATQDNILRTYATHRSLFCQTALIKGWGKPVQTNTNPN